MDRIAALIPHRMSADQSRREQSRIDVPLVASVSPVEGAFDFPARTGNWEVATRLLSSNGRFFLTVNVMEAPPDKLYVGAAAADYLPPAPFGLRILFPNEYRFELKSAVGFPVRCRRAR